VTSHAWSCSVIISLPRRRLHFLCFCLVLNLSRCQVEKFSKSFDGGSVHRKVSAFTGQISKTPTAFPVSEWLLNNFFFVSYSAMMQVILSRDSSDSIGTTLRAGRPGFYSRWGLAIFSPPPRPDRLWGPPSFLPNGYRALFPWRVKQPGREADHTSIDSRGAKTAWSCISTPPCVLMAWYLVKHGDIFTFTFVYCLYARRMPFL
jgi:hypothetical protein